MTPTAPSLTRGYAPAATGQVHYYDSGGGGVPLLMLHQSPTSSTDFAATFPFFQAAGRRVIAVDTPGLGMSSAPSFEPTIEDYADAAISVLNHLGIETADAVGHHTGVQTALVIAKRHPERLRKLALYGVPLMTDEERRRWWEEIVPREKDPASYMPQPGGGHLTDLFQKVERFFGTTTAHAMVVSRLMAGPKLWYAHNAALGHDIRPYLEACDHPMLFISHPGEMLDANTAAAKTLKPMATLANLGVNCSVAMYDEPKRFVECVVDFLDAPDN